MKKIIVFVVTVTIYLGCNVNPENAVKNWEKDSVIRTEQISEAIELDNGERWIVNDEMKPFVSRGHLLVDDFIQNKSTDHKLLADQLMIQNDQLIQSCTMDGKGHEELHKWLLPI